MIIEYPLTCGDVRKLEDGVEFEREDGRSVYRNRKGKIDG